MGRFGEWVLRLRWGLIVVGVGLIVLSAIALPKVRLDISIIPLLAANEDLQEKVTRFAEELPPVHYDQAILLEWPRALTHDDLALVDEWTTALEAEPHVFSVMNLARAPLVEHGGERPRLTTFFEASKTTPISDLVDDHPLVRRSLVSDDVRSLALFVVRDRRVVTFAGDDFLPWLERRFDHFLDGTEIHPRFIGDAVFDRQVETYMRDDLVRSLALETLVCLLVLVLLMRSVRGVVLPLVVLLTALLFCAGVLVAFDGNLGIIDIAIPGLIIVIGLCDAIHMVHRFEEGLAAGLSRRDAIVGMMRRVGAACVLTSMTTAFGFLSLLIAGHETVRQFGVKASVAVAVTFVAVIVVIPVGLSFWPVRRAAVPRLPGRLRIGFARAPVVMIVTVVVVGLSLLGARRVVVDAHWLEEMPPEASISKDLDWAEHNFAGVMTLEMRVAGDLADPAVFAAVERLKAVGEAFDGVRRTESYTDWVREAAGKQGEIDAAGIRRGLELLRFTGPHYPHHVLNPDGKTAAIIFRTKDFGTNRFLELRDRLERTAADDDSSADMTAEVAGFMLMAHVSSRLVVTTMLESFGLSLAAITLLIVVIYRSIRIALISVVVNSLPLLVTLGVCGWLGIPLRIGIAMIFSLGLGLAVDDSIHMITRFRQEQRRDPKASRKTWLERTLRSSGVALVATSAVLMLGTLCYLPSSFRSLRDLGILLPTVIVSAVVADLFLLPVLMGKWGRKSPSEPNVGGSVDGDVEAMD